MSRIILDLGHCGATGGNPPAKSGDLREDVIVARYAAAMQEALLAADHVVELAGAGTYVSRRLFAQGAQAYLALHVNAEAPGKPMDYGLVTYNATGVGLAQALRFALQALRWQDGAMKLARVMAPAGGTNGWPKATLSLIEVPCPGVVVEPGFITNPEHAGLWTPAGCRALGLALGAGVVKWLAESQKAA